jgi:hypothetical protein
MAAALVTGLGHRPLSRFNLLVPLAAAMLGTLVYDAVYLLTLAALNMAGLFERSLPLWDIFRYVVFPAMLYNTALMLLVLPLLNRVPESQDI